VTGIINKNMHDKNLRIKKEFPYTENISGDSSGESEKEDHKESTTHVHKGTDINKEDGKKPASDDEKSDDRREQTKFSRRSTPFGKGPPHTTTKRNASSTTSTGGRQLALAPTQHNDTSGIHISKTTSEKMSRDATHNNDAVDGVYKTTDATRKASPPMGTSSQRTQKSVQRDRTGGVRRWFRDSSSGDQNSEGEGQQIPTTKTNTPSRTITTKTTVRAGERSESGREIGRLGGERDRIKGTTVDLTDGLMGNDASDKNKGGIQRMQKSVQRDQTRGVRELYRDSLSGDENSEDERKQIRTTQSKTGGGETRTSTKGLLHKGGIRKSQSGGAREEDFENQGGGRAVAAGKKRTLEAHAPAERPEKRRNHNGRDVTSTNGSNHGTNPVLGGMGEEGAVGGTGKRKGMCEHQRRRRDCKDCVCNSFCEHQRRRSRCKDCGGSSICEHQRYRSTCKDCGGGSIREHQRMRSRCKECGGGSFCEHQRERSRCKDCGGSSLWEHQRQRSDCKDCGGSGLCKHQRVRRRCKDCGGIGICEHQRIQSNCKDCGGANICEHKRQKSRCKDCGDCRLCEHQWVKDKCKVCRGAKDKAAPSKK